MVDLAESGPATIVDIERAVRSPLPPESQRLAVIMVSEEGRIRP